MTEPPTTFGKYRILREIGRGSFGIVFLAEDTSLHNRPVALKVLYPQLVVDPATLHLFRQEAGTTALLDHPNIVSILEAGELEGRRFLAMRYIPGRTLAQVIEQEGPQPLDRIARWLDQIASALDYAHTEGVLHRDIKPGNILLDRQERAVLTDFGLSKAVASSGGSASSQQKEILSGTARYMAPEQARGNPVPQSDIYSLGAVLYELLTGKVPFDADDPFAIAILHMTEPPRPLRELRPELPEGVEAVVLKALAKEPGQRYRTAGEMAAAFRAAVEAAGHAGPRKARKDAEDSGPRKTRKDTEVAEGAPSSAGPGASGSVPGWAWGLIGALLLALAGTGGLALRGCRSATPTAVVQVTDSRLPPTDTPVLRIGSTRTRQADGTVMVYVPEGEFTMGSAESEHLECSWGNAEHLVYLDAFWIDRTEATVEQYRSFVNATGHRAPTACGGFSELLLGDASMSNRPIVCVGRDDAVAYCEWAGARLPTDAEWEKAARGTDGRTYPWGSTFNGALANYCDECGSDCGVGTTPDGYSFAAPVGSFPDGASPCGALDMAGNVWEWVSDWWSKLDSSSVRNPQGPAAGQERILRGGGYLDWCDCVTTTTRLGTSDDPDWGGTAMIGFRCAASATPSP